MAQLPTNRTPDPVNTPEIHAADHNELHRLHNLLELSGVRKRQTITLATDVTIMHCAPTTKILSGTFVPFGTEVDVYIEVAGHADGWAWMPLLLTYGIADGAGRLRSATQYAAPIAGATEIYLGSTNALTMAPAVTAPVSFITLSGLTPGGTYTLWLEGNVVSGSDTTEGLGGSYSGGGRLAMLPNGKKLYVTYQVTNVIQVIDAPWQTANANLSSGQHPTPVAFADAYRRNLVANATTGTILWPMKQGASPDSSRVVVPQFYGDATLGPVCLVIETTNDTVERVVNPGAFPYLGYGYYTAKFLDNTACYLSANNGHIYKVNVATGALITDITVFAGETPFTMDFDAAGTYLYTVGYASSKLYRINVATNAVTSQALNAGAQNIFGMRVGSDGRIYIGLANGTIEIRNSDLTYNSTIAAPAAAAASAVNCITASKDRTLLFIGFANGTVGFFVIGDGSTAPPWFYFDVSPRPGTSVVDIALGPEEQIYVTYDTGVDATSYIYVWQGVKASIRPSWGNFLAESAKLTIEGVQ